MMKAAAKLPNGDTLLTLGLSFANLDFIRQRPGHAFIKIKGKDTGGIPVDIIIFAGQTEAHCAEAIKEFIGTDTRVVVDPKLKS